MPLAFRLWWPRASALAFLSVLSTGCASKPLYDFAVGGGYGGLNLISLAIGLGIAWYCWTEAKSKNRSPGLWLFFGLVFGFFALLVLVYLKKLPPKPDSSEKEPPGPEAENE